MKISTDNYTVTLVRHPGTDRSAPMISVVAPRSIDLGRFIPYTLWPDYAKIQRRSCAGSYYVDLPYWLVMAGLRSICDASFNPE